jgi:uncharacterized Tic20 family protein
MSIAEEIERLSQLRRAGALSEEEFVEAKARVLRGDHAAPFAGPDQSSYDSPQYDDRYDDYQRLSGDLSANQWAMALHLSLLAGYAIPLAGFVVPVVIWQIKKDQFPIIDHHGRNAVNWMISSVLYLVLSFILAFVLIGIIGFLLLGLLAVACPIIAAVKASSGEVWKYPLAIEFV